jgi:type I restriction enzyme S subunit
MKDGWVTKSLGDIALVGAGNSAPQDKALFVGGSYPFFRTSDVGRIHIGTAVEAEDKLNENGIRRLTLHPAGTILIPKSGASTFLDHRVVMGVDGYVSSHLATVRAKPEIVDIKYLFYYLLTVESRSLGVDTAYPTLSLSQVNAIGVALPSLPEQKRIVAILDEAFAGLATATANAGKNLKNARELFDSYLNSVFAQSGSGWATKTLNKICVFENGDRGKNYPSRSLRVAKGLPFINAGHLRDDGIDLENLDFIPRARFDLLSNGKIRQGDILFCLRGSLGKFASVGGLSEGAIASSLVIVRATEAVIQDFLLLYFSSYICANMIAKFSNGAAQPNLSARSLGNFEVPVPTTTEQIRIVKQCRELKECTRDLAENYREKRYKILQLRQSILQKAFAGELTSAPMHIIQQAAE